MSYPYPPSPKKSTGGGIAVLLVVALLMGVYILYTDEISSTVQNVQTANQVGGTIKGITDLIPLSLANVADEGEIICDLDLQIPTALGNTASLGTPISKIISDEMGKKLPNIARFLNQPEYLYIQIEGVPSPTAEWKNCYEQGKGGITEYLPLLNGQLASEKLSLLSFGEKSKEIPLDPSMASQPPQTTFNSVIELSIFGKNDEGQFLVDKYGNGGFQRTVKIKNDLNYAVLDSVRFTIENVKADDYDISISSFLPINEKKVGEPHIIKICGIDGC